MKTYRQKYREQLLGEVWQEDVRDEILTCVVMREENTLRENCKIKCDLYPICKKVFEMEEEKTYDEKGK